MIEFVKQKKELHKMLADLAGEAQNDVRQEDTARKKKMMKTKSFIIYQHLVQNSQTNMP